jgi:hypothetical protein
MDRQSQATTASAVDGELFFLRIAAEISVMSRPIGKGSIKLNAALVNGLSSSAFIWVISCRVASIACWVAPDALNFST